MDNEWEVEAVIRQWLNKQIEAAELLRTLVSFDKWDVLVDDEELFAAMQENRPTRWAVREENGVKHLLVFTGFDAGRVYLGAGRGGSFTPVPGINLFSSIDERFDRLSINAGSDTAVSYGKEHFSMLREMAEAVKLQRSAKDLRLQRRKNKSLHSAAQASPTAPAISRSTGKSYVQINYKEALWLASGTVWEAEYDSTIFWRLPTEWIEGESVKAEKLEVVYQLLYGANWRYGNEDGSRYLVLRPDTHILTTAEEQGEPWRNLNLHDKNHHYWFFKVSDSDEVVRVQQTAFF